MNVPMCIEELVSQLSNTTLFWRLTLINKLGAYLYEKPKTERKKDWKQVRQKASKKARKGERKKGRKENLESHIFFKIKGQWLASKVFSLWFVFWMSVCLYKEIKCWICSSQTINKTVISISYWWPFSSQVTGQSRAMSNLWKVINNNWK